MNELWQSSEREGSMRFALLKRASAARRIPPLRLIVGCVTHLMSTLTFSLRILLKKLFVWEKERLFQNPG
jgi:hypothetical protein